jgi:hypothetical protein
MDIGSAGGGLEAGPNIGVPHRRPMTLGRFIALFLVGLVVAIGFQLTWLFWLLGVALLLVVLKLTVLR